MNQNDLTKKDLLDIINRIKMVFDSAMVDKSKEANLIQFSNAATPQSDLEGLIGTIPFLLLNKKIFERNQDIADFAQKLGIIIPSPEKKKGEDMIGRIISAIAGFDEQRIREVNTAIKSIKKTDIKKGKSNFFKDWENAIKNMKL